MFRIQKMKYCDDYTSIDYYGTKFFLFQLTTIEYRQNKELNSLVEYIFIML